jgi:ubiquinone/menaquinone biosynthesis C-methylase UbiE
LADPSGALLILKIGKAWYNSALAVGSGGVAHHIKSNTMLPKWMTQSVEDYRARRIAHHVAQFVAPHDTVLDCGCGAMLVAHELYLRVGAKIFGSDVLNFNTTPLSNCLCPGERLAFANASIDTVCLIAVLHHTNDPTLTLNECLRVARRRLIIMEDVYHSSFELWVLKTLDWLGNRALSEDMSLPFNFKPEPVWRQLFESLGVRVFATVPVRPMPFLPARYRLFVLDKH